MRFRLHESVIQRAVTEAGGRGGADETCHLSHLRSFIQDALSEAGYDIRTVWELLGSTPT